MGDPHQHPVYFDCPDMDAELSKRIENYFHIRRKSGGGDCGAVTKVNDKVYSIAFKDRNDQQRVLKKAEHVLKLKSGSLVLNVRDGLGPGSSPVAASNAGPSCGPELDSQQPELPPSHPTCNEDYELHLDQYLLRYLKECHKAKKELEAQLAYVGCSVQYCADKEKVLVKRLAQSGAVDEAGDWKAEVHKLFDGYLCHYELDSHKVKALLQSCSAQQSTDEVKVYSELGMAVVVGECSQVEARLINIESSHVKHKGSRLSETTVLRLGEAKLRLLWKDIEDSLRQKIPGVNIKQIDAGQLGLEGPVEEIVKARELIHDMETLVSEKILSDRTPHFLAFLRKVYGGRGVLGNLLEVGDSVEVELRDTELHFFSFSADKLDEAEKKMQEEFKDIKFEVPNCSIVPPELREMLKSKTSEMNQEQCRAQVVFGSENTVCLLGHTKEAEELSDIVIQFILDSASIQGKVMLPFPEVMHLLPELLQLHKLDHSGVTFHPLTSSSEPMVGLEGPSSKVTEVRNRLGPLLDSLVQQRITIHLPGAVRYFESHSAKESILRVAQSQKCLILLDEQPRANRQNSGVAKYNLQHGLQVLVCQGDITKQYADALVNAANEDLDHGGGVAAALSKAGGPQVQKESKALVKQTGKIPTGDVVVTTGGNLKCKKLLHAVGPVAGKPRGKERMLLEKTVQTALNLAEMMEFKSIAMPCISSGIFGVPLNVCSEAIVTAVKEFGSQGGRSLSKIILIDNRSEVVRAMQDACDRLLNGRSTAHSTPWDLNVNAVGQDAARGATAGAPGGIVHVEIVQGTIETQEVDALVSPMVGHDPLSTRVGNALINVAGRKLTENFQKEAGGVTMPGDIVLVESLPPLKSKAVVFLNQVCWDKQGSAAQVLRQGIRKILASCVVRGFSSVAFPVLGIGASLRFPHDVASRVLLEEVGMFEQNRTSRSPFLVRVVIHPSDKESRKAFQSAQEILHLKGYTSDADPDQVSFYRCISTTNDEITAMLSGVKLQMVQGDIINGGTDVIVNTTDFSNSHSGVSKAILTAAGPAVQAELAQIGIPSDFMCTTGPGLLGCREIIHASFKSDPETIRKKCKKILKQCESKGYHSVAFPAINTGMGGLDSSAACKAMLDGMGSAISKLKPNSLSLIRIVILQQPVFQVFRKELENRFGQITPCRPSLKERAKQMLKKLQDRSSKTSKSSAAQGKPPISSKPQPAVINVISCGPDVVKTVQRELEEMLQKQLVERVVEAHHFDRLDAMNRDAVLANVAVLGISMEHRSQSSVTACGSRDGSTARAEARAQSQSGQDDVYVLKGLKEDVLSVTDLINRAIQQALCDDIKDREKAVLALTIQWSIKDINGAWQEFGLHDNFILEEAHVKKQDSVDVVTPDGVMVSVDLKKQEAVNKQTGITYTAKRSNSENALELPDSWEPMHDETFKKVELQSNSYEYQLVAAGFARTANYNIVKIERVQNLYQWYAYSLFKQRILAKNGAAEIGEKSLYHGTSAASCECIEKGKFDRSFAGQHAAMYGKGVYFAVNASYSARRYSPPDSSGLKRVYVALVLTGRYTVGNATMKTTPPRGLDPTDCFDSLVDNQQKPSMFVIFHDDQAYPEYLITFK